MVINRFTSRGSRTCGALIVVVAGPKKKFSKALKIGMADANGAPSSKYLRDFSNKRNKGFTY
jgi:hypothetical protein